MPRGRFVSRCRCGVVVVACAALLLSACAEAERDPAGDAREDDTRESAEAGADADEEHTDDVFAAGEELCERERAGVAYEVGYPASWWTHDGDQRCRMFHPEPYDMPEQPQDVPGMGVVFDVAGQPLQEVAEPFGAEVRAEEETTVAGRSALVQEIELTEETLYPEGARITRHLVDLDDRTFVASTTDQAAAGAYDDNRAALAGMIERLDITGVEEPDRAGDDAPEA